MPETQESPGHGPFDAKTRQAHEHTAQANDVMGKNELPGKKSTEGESDIKECSWLVPFAEFPAEFQEFQAQIC